MLILTPLITEKEEQLRTEEEERKKKEDELEKINDAVTDENKDKEEEGLFTAHFVFFVVSKYYL